MPRAEEDTADADHDDPHGNAAIGAVDASEQAEAGAG
jgi:hypothetical protein